MPSRTLRTFCLAIPFLAALSGVPAQASAQSVSPSEERSAADADGKQEAARRFEHGISLYEEGDYALALAEFERVYELVPDYRVLYNIGQMNMQLGRYARALRTLREYVSRGGDELPPDRRVAVQADLRLLETRTATLELDAQPVGAEIWIDGALVGRSPLADAVIVDVGQRTVEVRFRGHVSRTQLVTLAGGDRREVKVALQPERSAAAPQSLPAKPREPLRAPPTATSSGTSPWIWAGWTTTGLLAASSAVSAALGASALSDLKDLRESRTAGRADLDAAGDRVAQRFLIADVLGAAALVAGGTTLYFHLSDPKSTKPAEGTKVGINVLPTSMSIRIEH
jgi:tetratricopeptide (TPR) repeat protein